VAVPKKNPPGRPLKIPWKPLFCPPTLARDVTEHLQLLLRKGGYHFHTTAEKEIVRIIKEKTCYLPLNPAKEEKDTGEKKEDFMLPDGNTIKVGYE